MTDDDVDISYGNSRDMAASVELHKRRIDTTLNTPVTV